jgi:hypothetical protein
LLHHLAHELVLDVTCSGCTHLVTVWRQCGVSTVPYSALQCATVPYSALQYATAPLPLLVHHLRAELCPADPNR